MRPYSRKNTKIRVRNRSKFNATNKIVSDFAPRDWPGKIAPVSLLLTRVRKSRRLTKDQKKAYRREMT